MEYHDNLKAIEFDEVIKLYNDAGWSNYTEDTLKLKSAFENSDYIVFATSEKKLIGLSRSLSDDSSIHYLQDILVLKEFQGKGVGSELLRRSINRFSHVRAHVLLTDDNDQQKAFYSSLGFINTKEIKESKLNAFVKFKGIELN